MNLLFLLIILAYDNILTSVRAGSLRKTKNSNKYNIGQDNSQTPANDFYNNQNYFQDIFMEHSKPLELEFGHVFETPSKWEQRFEKNDIENKRYQGKVRWGNNEGSYGEHYWDLNHRR